MTYQRVTSDDQLVFKQTLVEKWTRLLTDKYVEKKLEKAKVKGKKRVKVLEYYHPKDAPKINLKSVFKNKIAPYFTSVNEHLMNRVDSKKWHVWIYSDAHLITVYLDSNPCARLGPLYSVILELGCCVY
jgi:hypothetical protein